jgi:hypothetical protein
MARTLTALAAVTLALTLAGCSSSDNTPGDTQAGSTPAVTTQSSDDDGGGSVDCTALTGDDAGTYTIGLQLMAQMRSQAVIDSMKSGGATYDPDIMEGILTKLKTLAGHDILGDPGPDVDFYIEANNMAREILATSGPVPQSMFDDLAAFQGDAAEFLGHQLTINSAYSDACN